MQVKEEAFALLFRSGSVRSVSIKLLDGGSVIGFVLGDGSEGLIYTRRGQPKRYRLDTAARFLRGLSVATVPLDMTLWTVEQRDLAM